MNWELGLYRTENGRLARVTRRSHGQLLHGRVMEDTPQRKWLSGGTWRIYPWAIDGAYTGLEARFEHFGSWNPVPGLNLSEYIGK